MPTNYEKLFNLVGLDDKKIYNIWMDKGATETICAVHEALKDVYPAELLDQDTIARKIGDKVALVEKDRREKLGMKYDPGYHDYS